MEPFILRVDHAEQGHLTEWVADTSPVRIGRDSLNELYLPFSFVSSWHGIIRFDADGTYYSDISSNGTLLDEVLVEKGVEIPLRLGSVLRIGPVTITVGSPSPAHDGAEEEDEEDLLTVVSAKRNPPRPLDTPTMAAGELGISQLQDGYTEYRRAAEALLRALRAQLASLGPAGKRDLLELVEDRMPELAAEPGFRAISLTAGAGLGRGSSATASAADIGELLGRALPWVRAPRTDEEVELLLDRSSRVLGTFCGAFIGLQRAHAEFCNETGIQVARGRSPLHEGGSESDVLAYLLDWDARSESRLQELKSVFTDVSMHQVALWDAIAAGVKALLHALSPPQIETLVSSEKRTRWPFKATALWNRYSELLSDLQTDETVLDAVFLGSEFRRAYSRVLGRKSDEHADATMTLSRKAPGARKKTTVPIPPQSVKAGRPVTDDEEDDVTDLGLGKRRPR